MKMKTAFLAALVGLAVSRLAASNYQVVSGVTWYYDTTSTWDSQSRAYVTNAIIVKGGNVYTGRLTVPQKLGGFTVTQIGSYAFQDCIGLMGVSFPNSVTSIGSYAFSGCTALASVTLPNALTSIGYEAFYGCTVLTKIVMPNTVTSVSSDVFWNCSKLTSVTLSTALTSISSGLFYGCSSLTSVNIPAGVTSIGSSAFSGCTKLQNVTLPSALETINDQAFYNCKAFTRMTIPKGVTLIGERVFGGCDNLTSFSVASGNSSYKVSSNCLVSSKTGLVLTSVPFGLETISIPAGVTYIPAYMFQGDYQLKSVTLPSGVTDIRDYSFQYCSNLVSVTIPASVLRIGDRAFYGCYGLQSAVLNNCPAEIGEYAFYNCTMLSSVDLGAKVKSISYEAFYYCSSLKNVTIPASVESVGYYSFPSSMDSVVFLGAPPSGMSDSRLLSAAKKSYPREHGAEWQKLVGFDSFSGFLPSSMPEVTVVSTTIRPDDPTVMDVVYKVKSSARSVRVRALAFVDGERSFAKVLRPSTFIEGTAENVGDAIAPNVDHKLSWSVAEDWKVDLAKVKVEILVREGELLPLELVSIPAGEGYGAMEVSWNALDESQFLDALFWLYADKTAGLMLDADGTLTSYGTTLVKGTSFQRVNSAYPAVDYVFAQMGYRVLAGDMLGYVKEETRYALNPSGFRQYAVKILP